MTDPSSAGPRVVHLRRGGTSVVLRLGDRRLPTVLHWGADLGDVADDLLPEVLVALRMPLLDSAVTVQDAVAVLPQRSSG